MQDMLLRKVDRVCHSSQTVEQYEAAHRYCELALRLPGLTPRQRNELEQYENYMFQAARLLC